MNELRAFVLGMLFALLGTFAYSKPCAAEPGDWWLGVQAVSLHDHDAKRGPQYNERHWVLGIDYQYSEDWRGGVATFKNSRYRDSFTLAAAYQPIHATSVVIPGKFHYGVTAGGLTGYLNHPIPMLAPVGTWESRQWAVDFVPIPTRVYFVYLRGKF